MRRYRLDPIVNIIEFEKLRFRPSTRKRENSVFEKLHIGERFQKPPFRLPKTPFTCGRKAKTDQKISVFKNIRIRAGGALASNVGRTKIRLNMANVSHFSEECIVHTAKIYEYAV